MKIIGMRFFGALILLMFVAPEKFLSQDATAAKLLVDTLDNKIDISEFLRTRYGFAFIPTIITEPALGYGGGGGIIFIHRDPTEIEAGKGKYPSLSGIGGFYTESKSWAIGGGHFGVWKDGDIRYRGGGGLVDANLDYYREPIFQNGIERIGFNIKAWGIIQEIIFRLGKSNFFAGASYAFSNVKVSFDLSSDFPEINPRDYESNIGGLGAVLYFDSRDNMFTPNRGVYAGLKSIFYDGYFGSDRNFTRLFFHLLAYTPLTKNLYGAGRIDVKTAFNDVPFYLRPFISLRGVPAMRYQGETTYLAETEFRWDFTRRWSIVGFCGYGEATPISDEMFDKQSAYNIGAGFRYLIARLYGVRMGIDIARGPEEWAFYIQFGSAWFRY
jgi:hypothetical protein